MGVNRLGACRMWNMRTGAAILPVLAALLGQGPARGAEGAAEPTSAARERPRLWLYVQGNLLAEENVRQTIALAGRAAAAGYTGIVLADSKFMRWDAVPPAYAANVARVRDACRAGRLDVIACVFPMGYSNDLLSRDPNLAEGLPARGVPFVVRGGALVPAAAGSIAVNGGFEEHRGHSPAGWAFVDQPGRISFIDTSVRCEGAVSLRMENIGRYDPAHGNGRACQRLRVSPFTPYHVSVSLRTRDFETPGEVEIKVLGPGNAMLNYFRPPVARTQEWKRMDIVFNSLDAGEVGLYLGVWGGRGGTIWWDDLRVEPAGPVNVLRRPGAPVRATSRDGRTVYAEGRDFGELRDPKLGTDPWPGCYTAWHEPPVVRIPPGGALREGDAVLLSWYHPALIYEGAVACCMAEPKVYDILRWQAGQVRAHLAPDGYFMQHDEIRTQGWDESCEQRGLRPGELLAENVRKCREILAAADPGKPVCVWSDMFDPGHNARRQGRYYLVRGDGPWYGSWKGLPPDVTVANWRGDRENRSAALRHFADLGLRQVLAGYYDGNPADIAGWLADAAAVQGVDGVMYTTWRRRFGDLEKFAEAVRGAKPPR